jgi:hypothetical protein
MSNRELIERDQNYQQLKRVILHLMDNTGVTPWYSEEQWLETLPRWTMTQYRRWIIPMIEDKEIRREYDRDARPLPKTRWVMRNTCRVQQKYAALERRHPHTQ